jgi:hypothetical protein
MAKIERDAVNREARKIVKAQMSDGGDEIVSVGQLLLAIAICGDSSANVVMQARKELWINFATAKNVAWFAWHAATILAHPLQIMRIVSANLKAPGVPRPKALALGTEHLITALGFVNENLAIGAWFCVGLEKGDGSDGVGIANM